MIQLSKNYLEKSYRQLILDFQCASNENQRWDIRKAMAKLELIAMETYGFDYADSLSDFKDVLK